MKKKAKTTTTKTPRPKMHIFGAKNPNRPTIVEVWNAYEKAVQSRNEAQRAYEHTTEGRLEDILRELSSR